MKNLLLLFLIVVHSPVLLSNTGKNKGQKDGSIRIYINNHKKIRHHTDSILVIIDRYDRTYAGVINQIFYPGASNTIQIAGLKAGKYVVSIVFLGFHSDRFTKIVHTRNRKVTPVKIALAHWDEFSREDLFIPDEFFDLCNLRITSMK